ncbi:hypothetical protein ACFY8F_37275 [Streptomyces tanashiensis]|uniref:hypothetical protein n=1 Tax=Streptomyces tanashiensis TaxID=67367 RepID=UPI003677C601
MTQTGPDRELAAAMEDADSPLWSVRADAGRRLASAREPVGVADVLHRLLLDAHDTGVTQETAEALLAREDTWGLRTVLAALSRAVDTWTLDQLSSAVDCDPSWMTEEGERRLVRQLQKLKADDDAGVRDEAERLLKPILRHRQSCDG